MGGSSENSTIRNEYSVKQVEVCSKNNIYAKDKLVRSPSTSYSALTSSSLKTSILIITNKQTPCDFTFSNSFSLHFQCSIIMHTVFLVRFGNLLMLALGIHLSNNRLLETSPNLLTLENLMKRRGPNRI